MTAPGPNNTSGTARLMVNPPGFAVGWQTPVYVPNPAVGAEWTYTVDGRYSERLIAARFTFTASATVANRFPQLVLEDSNGTIFCVVPAGSTVVAGDAVSPSLVAGAPVLAQAPLGDTVGFLPDLLIPAGWSWGTRVFGLDAGDQFAGITLLVQRFPNDATAITAEG